ncbi:C-Myc-binding protein-like protein [Diplonema papillatum]|nr:C-Myc-binding protein-like protein [Diplonema papillatum]|eukprot:gene6406-9804_t
MTTYQSSESKKEDFRKYLEKSNVIDALTKVLVTLYEEPERPEKPVEFIKKALGGPSQSDYDNLRAENDELKERIAKLEADLRARGDDGAPAES